MSAPRLPASVTRRRFLVGGGGLVAAGALAGCASADKNQSTGTQTESAASSSGMAGMNMGDGGTKVSEINGVPPPVASQVLATTTWQGMQIQARTMTPVTFVTFNGTKEQLVKPPKDASFHLMVMLSDVHTQVTIPYATVWATILNSAGRPVYDDQQWQMISAYMGPHYGNNVKLPGPGQYTLKLLISPPVSARHLEYEHVWLKQHEVRESFSWKPHGE